MTTKESQLDEITYAGFKVTDSGGTAVTGLTTTHFTISLYNPAGSEVSATTTDGITELGLGMYRYYFTPTTEGIYTVKIVESSYLPTGVTGEFEVHQDRAWLQRTLGMVQENIHIDQYVFSGTNMTSGRMRIYSEASSVATTNDVIGTYTITATYDANNNVSDFQIAKQ